MKDKLITIEQARRLKPAWDFKKATDALFKQSDAFFATVPFHEPRLKYFKDLWDSLHRKDRRATSVQYNLLINYMLTCLADVAQIEDCLSVRIKDPGLFEVTHDKFKLLLEKWKVSEESESPSREVSAAERVLTSHCLGSGQD